MSFTPGPWRVDGNARDVRSGGVGGLFIARTYAIPIEDNPDDHYAIQQMANARLIAASPDLLAAAESALSVLTCYGGEAETTVSAELRDAIAKAKR